MTCKHHPRSQIKLIFARKPQYVCRVCGEPIEMARQTRNLNRVMNTVFVALLLFKALSTGRGEPSVRQMLIDFGILLGMVLLYVLAFFLLLRFGQFEETVPAEAAPAEEPPAEELPPAAAKPQYTQEQLDLMALYDAYEKQAGAEGTASPTRQDRVADQPPMAHPEAACAHVPAKNWKNFIPSHYDFTCANCGQKITFGIRTKRSMNMAFLGVMVVILMPTFNNFNIKFWQYALLTLGTLLVASVVQYVFVRKGPFELKNPPAAR